MVRSTRLSRALGLAILGLGVVGMLAVAVPADAVTTHVDMHVLVVHTTNENFISGSYPAWAPEGPATFPSVVVANQATSDVLQSYQPDLSVVPVGCTANLLSFTVDLEALQILQGQTVQIGYYVGIPAKPVVGTTQTFAGSAIVDTDPGGFFHLYQQGTGLDGTLTVTLPSTITTDDAPFGWVGLDLDGPARGPLWQINSASYQADITCPDQGQEQEQAPGKSLAATGTASAGLIGAAGFVLAGVGVVLLARARRSRAN